MVNEYEIKKQICEIGKRIYNRGMVASNDGTWIYFDYVPGEKNIRTGKADVTGKLCVIGSNLNEHEIEELFGV